MKLVLGSASPRRHEILSRIGYPFTTHVSYADESVDAGLGLEGLSTYNARLKAEDVFASLGAPADTVVIGSDTVVWLDGVAYGKPKDATQARLFLTQLAGRTHQVGTGVALTSAAGTETFCEIADVTFQPMTEDDITAYLRDIPVMDKAGAYAIQGDGGRIITQFTGEMESIMGLPYTRLAERLRRLL